MLHLSLPSGPSAQYVNNKLLSGAHVKGGGGTQKYSTSKVSCPVRWRTALSPRPSLLLNTAPALSRPPRVVELRTAARRPRAVARGPGRPHGALRVTAAALCFQRRGVSHRPPRARSWAHTPARAAANFAARAATEAAAASSSSSSSASATATAAPRPPPPPPASAQSPPPPHANLVSGSRRRAAIGRRNAPRHNGAGRRRRAR